MIETAEKPSASPMRECPRCGAVLPAGAISCWLCLTQVSTKADELGRSSRGRAALTAEPAGGFSLASLMMLVTLVCVVLGVSTIAPGVGIPLGLLLLVVWLRTAAVARQRAARGLEVTRPERVHLFLTSFGVTMVLIVLTCVAGCATFVAACFACAAAWGVGGEGVGVLIFALVAAAIAIPIVWRMGKFVYRRWRHDIGEPD
jgi:hypothetical protein